MHDWVDDDTNMDATAERGTPLLQVLGAENHLIRGLLVNLQGLAAFGSRVHIRVVVHPVVHACNRISCMHDLNSEI